LPSRERRPRFPGGYRGGVTPVPIPNTEVKPSTADGTAREALWESRSLPGIDSRPDAQASGLSSFVDTARRESVGLFVGEHRAIRRAGLFPALRTRKARGERQHPLAAGRDRPATDRPQVATAGRRERLERSCEPVKKGSQAQALLGIG
jgi:hypothetical protein